MSVFVSEGHHRCTLRHPSTRSNLLYPTSILHSSNRIFPLPSRITYPLISSLDISSCNDDGLYTPCSFTFTHPLLHPIPAGCLSFRQDRPCAETPAPRTHTSCHVNTSTRDIRHSIHLSTSTSTQLTHRLQGPADLFIIIAVTDVHLLGTAVVAFKFCAC